jgi:hypothetical protein
MKNKANPQKLHIGSMIKEIALQKDVSPKELADVILCYQKNPGKIYDLDDMDTENVILISYLLNYNFLKIISKKYLSHLSFIENSSDEEKYYMELDTETGHFKIIGDIRTRDALQKIHIGQHIKAFALKNKWKEDTVAVLLNCSQSTVSDLYAHKSLKVKKLIEVSNALNHNFIADVYLDRMFILSSPDRFSRCIFTITPQWVRIENPDDKDFLMVFHK